MDGAVRDFFRFCVPLDIVKSDTTTPDGKPAMKIAGYASTSDKDRQDDEIIQKGLDISDFVEYGWLNYDHNNSIILGYPDKKETRIDNGGFFVSGYLLPDIPLAKSLWETALALKKSNAPRKLGFSIEGKALQRNSAGKITKAKVYNVAVTPNPVNTSCTWDALVKSFSAPSVEDVYPEDTSKAMSAGYAAGIGEVTNGAGLKAEDLEGAFRVLAKACGGDEAASAILNSLKDRLDLSKSINKNEMALYLQLTKGLSRSQAMAIIDTFEKEEQ